MIRFLRELLLLALLFAIGVGAHREWGEVPRLPRGMPASPETWRSVHVAPPDLKETDRVWVDRGPWGVPPKPPPVPTPPPPPAPVPVGIVATKRGPEVVFVVPGGEPFRVRVGAALPGGGRVTGVSRLGVRWIDRDGKKQQRELLSDPMPAQPH